jgi:hypothetical protein
MARNSLRTHGDGVKMAQSGGVSKGVASRPADPGGASAMGSKGSGLKTAWADQTARPSVLNNMSTAKKRVR